jgi:hypothetical protein
MYPRPEQLFVVEEQIAQLDRRVQNRKQLLSSPGKAFRFFPGMKYRFDM